MPIGPKNVMKLAKTMTKNVKLSRLPNFKILFLKLNIEFSLCSDSTDKETLKLHKSQSGMLSEKVKNYTVNTNGASMKFSHYFAKMWEQIVNDRIWRAVISYNYKLSIKTTPA